MHEVFFTTHEKWSECQYNSFYPKIIDFPKVTTDDFLRQAALDIISILQSPPASTIKSLEADDQTRNVLLKLATIFKTNEESPANPTEPLGVHSNDITTSKQLEPPGTSNLNNHNSLRQLQHTLAQLTRVQNQTKKQQQIVSTHSTPRSFKHRAATFLIESPVFRCPTEKYVKHYDT